MRHKSVCEEGIKRKKKIYREMKMRMLNNKNTESQKFQFIYRGKY